MSELPGRSTKNSGGVHEVIGGGTLLTDHDIYLFKEGSHFRLYEKLGSHPMVLNKLEGTHFSVWAPNAEGVSVLGDFNGWEPEKHPLRVRKDDSGIWEGFIPGVGHGSLYKYHVTSRHNGFKAWKGDPFALRWELPPRTASMVWDPAYRWGDGDWMRKRETLNAEETPWSIYELHLGSWRRNPEEGDRHLSYSETAERLVAYVKKMGFTHVELMPVQEHPFYGSWGYQSTGYFAPTSRYGTPQDLMALVDLLHKNGIGVILDWVPSHFPSDEHGLAFFDGTHLFEHADPRKGFHPEWSSYIFNYGRNEVRSFLISSAFFWLDRYHADGLRVDGVASMLYLDYARAEGEWIPNIHGGRENLDAVEFLKKFNEGVYGNFPGVQTIAEESTAWPMVSRPTDSGGLGFGMKWMMGWMHDALDYFSEDPVHRKFHQDRLTFSVWYAFHENYVLPLSHDEVVHGKGSLLGKMPGDEWQRFANLRLLFGVMFSHPGKKLLFMGSEFGQVPEWNHEKSLEWEVLEYPLHRGLQRWVGDLNRIYREEPALHERDFSPGGFEWIDYQDRENSVISFIRKGKTAADSVCVVANMTPVSRHHYRIGISEGGRWKELLNSDASFYGGGGVGNMGGSDAQSIPFHGRTHSLELTLPPLGILFLKKADDLS